MNKLPYQLVGPPLCFERRWEIVTHRERDVSVMLMVTRL